MEGTVRALRTGVCLLLLLDDGRMYRTESLCIVLLDYFFGELLIIYFANTRRFLFQRSLVVRCVSRLVRLISSEVCITVGEIHTCLGFTTFTSSGGIPPVCTAKRSGSLCFFCAAVEHNLATYLQLTGGCIYPPLSTPPLVARNVQ